jgi:hypothetical protein
VCVCVCIYINTSNIEHIQKSLCQPNIRLISLSLSHTHTHTHTRRHADTHCDNEYARKHTPPIVGLCPLGTRYLYIKDRYGHTPTIALCPLQMWHVIIYLATLSYNCSEASIATIFIDMHTDKLLVGLRPLDMIYMDTLSYSSPNAFIATIYAHVT